MRLRAEPGRRHRHRRRRQRAHRRSTARSRQLRATAAARPATSTSSWSTGPATSSAPPSRQPRSSRRRCPPDLRADVDDGGQSWQVRARCPTTQRRAAADAAGRRRRCPATPAGSRADRALLRLPADQEEESLSLIRSTVIISGVALTLFVVGIGVLVTRLVVDPVRRAAGTAQRLAEGQLEQRMAVRGEDDLARLATSFNAMADSLQRQITQLEGLSQLQQRFTSDVSHELRTPLTTVQMAADVLHDARGDFPPHVARSAELLRAELDRFEGLLTDLLEISRYDAGAAVLDSEPTDLGRAGRPGGGRHVVAGRAARVRAGGRTGPTRTSSPRSTRGGWSGSCATWSATPSSTAPGQPVEITLAANRTAAAVTVRDLGRRAELGRGPARLRPVLAGRPLAGPHRRRQRARPVDQPRGRPAARRLAAGLGPARRRRPVPAHAAADRRRRPHQLAAAAAPGRRPPSRDAGVSRRRARAGAARWRCCSAVSGLLDRAEQLADGADHPGARRGRPRTSASSRCRRSPGATPEEIVRGFIDAAASARAGHPVAREYLAPEAAGDVVRRGRHHRCISPDYADGGHRGRARSPLTGEPGRHRRPARASSPSAAPGVFTREFTARAGRRRVADHRPARTG